MSKQLFSFAIKSLLLTCTKFDHVFFLSGEGGRGGGVGQYIAYVIILDNYAV